MFEVRWLEKAVPIRIEASPGSYGGPMIDGIQIVKALQFRYPVNCHRSSIREPDPHVKWPWEWSEWFDVPTVREEVSEP